MRMDNKQLAKYKAIAGGDSDITLQEKTITENGTYTADAGFDALSKVIVDVAGSGGDEKNQLDALIDRSIEEISSNVTEIGNYAFYGCDSLTSADFPLATYIRQSGLHGCNALESLNAPLLEFVGASAFRDCKSLPRAEFPLATLVSNYSFYNCSSLKYLDVCASGLYTYALGYNSAMETMVLRNEALCSLGNATALDSSPIANGLGYIYVPAALVEEYKLATNWSAYADQFRALEDYTVDGTITGALDESKI